MYLRGIDWHSSSHGIVETHPCNRSSRDSNSGSTLSPDAASSRACMSNGLCVEGTAKVFVGLEYVGTFETAG